MGINISQVFPSGRWGVTYKYVCPGLDGCCVGITFQNVGAPENYWCTMVKQGEGEQFQFGKVYQCNDGYTLNDTGITTKTILTDNGFKLMDTYTVWNEEFYSDLFSNPEKVIEIFESKVNEISSMVEGKGFHL